MAKHRRAEVLPPTHELATRFESPEHAVRSVVGVDVTRSSDS